MKYRIMFLGEHDAFFRHNLQHLYVGKIIHSEYVAEESPCGMGSMLTGYINGKRISFFSVELEEVRDPITANS